MMIPIHPVCGLALSCCARPCAFVHPLVPIRIFRFVKDTRPIGSTCRALDCFRRERHKTLSLGLTMIFRRLFASIPVRRLFDKTLFDDW